MRSICHVLERSLGHLDPHFGEAATAEYVLRSRLKLDETPLAAVHSRQRCELEIW